MLFRSVASWNEPTCASYSPHCTFLPGYGQQDDMCVYGIGALCTDIAEQSTCGELGCTWSVAMENWASSSISYAPDSPDAPITMKIAHENDINSSKSLEWLKGDLQTFFQEAPFEPEGRDIRPTYNNRSSGYLKFRSLNNAIIIKNSENKSIGLENWEDTGFTIAIWIKFLNRNPSTSGTIFNYGNPLRANNPEGFMLDTSIREGYGRIIRLVVRSNSELYDSHIGVQGNPREDTRLIGSDDYREFAKFKNYESIDLDLNEWYYIVATYNKDILEQESFANNELLDDSWDPNGFETLRQSSEFWKWKVTPEIGGFGNWTSNSGYGAKCKVDVISRSDLLRARGFKSEKAKGSIFRQ